ncbi:MAG TPA: hypothetical protein DHW71_06260, partial [Gammaproteobacteria bacterium]|nr:hypothetical protein [Gammaproteobacteria bacterium]
KDSNGCIYGVPNCADQVLKIDPSKGGEVTLFGDYPKGDYQWHGGVKDKKGIFYAVPSHAKQVLKIDPENMTTTLIGDEIDPGLYRPKGKYKYGGSCLGDNGMIYCIPSDADRVLKIDTENDTVKHIGPSFAMHNKWQNGYKARDGHIYGIPCNADGLLQIDCWNDEVNVLEIDESTKDGFEKWEGGVLDNNGGLWCVPQNAKVVLKVHPEEKAE